MKLFLCLCLVAVTAAAPPAQSRYSQEDDVSILRYGFDNDGQGNYEYKYEQSDGTKQDQRGELRNIGLENESLVVQGKFTWIGPDGVTYTVTYTADEDGYRPEIEQGPGGGVPSAVVASLLG